MGRPDGTERPDGLRMHCVLGRPFRFCLALRRRLQRARGADFAKLATLGTEGRCTATSVTALSLAAGSPGRRAAARRARKLLTFTDNRQDAVAAGRATSTTSSRSRCCGRRSTGRLGTPARPGSTTKRRRGRRVALGLASESYAEDPDARPLRPRRPCRALRAVLAYRLYLDLQRGWRITCPTSSRSGCCTIDYVDLDELCRRRAGVGRHAIQRSPPPTPGPAANVAQILLDELRRELCLDVDCYRGRAQDRVKQHSRAVPRRALGARPGRAAPGGTACAAVGPRRRRRGTRTAGSGLSPRGGFGLYLKRHDTFPTPQAR